MNPGQLQVELSKLINAALQSGQTPPTEVITVLEVTKLDMYMGLRAQAQRIIQPAAGTVPIPIKNGRILPRPPRQ